MPSRRDFPQREENPNRRIDDWDDGFDPMPSARHHSPSPQRRRPNRNATHYPPRTRRFSPSPPRYGGGGANREYYADHPLNSNPNPDYRGRTSGPQRPPLTRSKSTSAKELLSTGLKTVQNLSPKWQKAAQAAVQAGGMAAWQARKQPGDWKGKKGVKVASAALLAAYGSAKLAGEQRDRERSRDRDHRYDERERSRERGYGRDRYEERDRSRDRGRDRGRDRYDERDRYDDRDRPRTGARRNSNLEALGNMVGGFVADQWAKRADKQRH